MILSMTGYGTGSAQQGDTVVTVEIRAVNHRFLDVHVRLPREYVYLETEIQQAVRGAMSRGRMDISVSIQELGASAFQLNVNSARGYIEAAQKLSEVFNLQDSLDLKTLLGMPGVLQNRESLPPQGQNGAGTTGELLAQSLQQAIEGVRRMREQEGRVLQEDMKRHLDSIGERAKGIHCIVPATVVEYRRKLEERLAQILPQNGIDPQRVAQEVAILADRCDISEEITRLESHVAQYAELMDTGREVGKKLDFLLQEMQREVNTILSKSANLEITGHGISIKAEIEKLREQAQNVE